MYVISACAANQYGKNCAQRCMCSPNAQSCDSVDGTCTCKAGWEGTLCETDINECLINRHNCSGDWVICINEDGGYSCGCEEGYKNNGSNICLGQCRFGHYKLAEVISKCCGCQPNFKFSVAIQLCHLLSCFSYCLTCPSFQVTSE